MSVSSTSSAESDHILAVSELTGCGLAAGETVGNKIAINAHYYYYKHGNVDTKIFELDNTQMAHVASPCLQVQAHSTQSISMSFTQSVSISCARESLRMRLH